MTDDAPEPQTFEDFWPYYVSQHADPTCRKLHFVGTSLALLLLMRARKTPALALAAPAVGYGMAWIGHFAFERNKPASWHSPKHFAWSLRGDLRMWRLIATGEMDAEVARVSAEAATDDTAPTDAAPAD